jgi:hypothetical protein
MCGSIRLSKQDLIAGARGNNERLFAAQYSYLLHLPDPRPALCATFTGHR